MDKQEMLALRLQGLTYQAIGEAAGISRQRVQKLLSPPAEIRRFVYDKFKGQCGRCSIHVGKSGHIHHASTDIGVDDYNDIPNLELLCISCHLLAHSKYGHIPKGHFKQPGR